MMRLARFLCLLISSRLFATLFASPIDHKFSLVDEESASLRTKRTTQLIEECMLVGVEEGTYLYKSRGGSDVCSLYLVSAPDQRIEITVDYLNADCDSGGIISLLDGWEMSGQVFPPAGDEPLESRVINLCGIVRKRHFVTSSNGAMVMYRLPKKGDTFRVSVQFVVHPKPCNILLTTDAEIVTLRNFGLGRNCTLATAFPASIRILQLSVGIESKKRKLHPKGIEAGILSRCHKRGFHDMVLVGGSPGLDTSSMRVEELFCGLDSNPRLPWSRILCDVSAVRLVSSGLYDNSVTVAVTPLTSLEDLPTTMCEVEN